MDSTIHWLHHFCCVLVKIALCVTLLHNKHALCWLNQHSTGTDPSVCTVYWAQAIRWHGPNKSLVDINCWWYVVYKDVEFLEARRTQCLPRILVCCHHQLSADNFCWAVIWMDARRQEASWKVNLVRVISQECSYKKKLEGCYMQVLEFKKWIKGKTASPDFNHFVLVLTFLTSLSLSDVLGQKFLHPHSHRRGDTNLWTRINCFAVHGRPVQKQRSLLLETHNRWQFNSYIHVYTIVGRRVNGVLVMCCIILYLLAG